MLLTGGFLGRVLPGSNKSGQASFGCLARKRQEGCTLWCTRSTAKQRQCENSGRRRERCHGTSPGWFSSYIIHRHNAEWIYMKLVIPISEIHSVFTHTLMPAHNTCMHACMCAHTHTHTRTHTHTSGKGTDGAKCGCCPNAESAYFTSLSGCGWFPCQVLCWCVICLSFVGRRNKQFSPVHLYKFDCFLTMYTIYLLFLQ